MLFFRKSLLILTGFLTTMCFAAPPTTVPYVSLSQYMGKWYEIASFPNFFQRHCLCTTAEYRLKGSDVSVRNRCYKGNDYQLSEAVAKAWAVPNTGNSQLKVQFFWPFKGDYWILYLTKGYQQVLVGSPKRDYLWILSRQRTISQKTYRQLLRIAREKGFDTTQLVKTKQNCPFRY